MTRVFIDTNVFVYALGREHPYRDPCRRIVDRVARGQIRGEVSVEVVQEFIYVRGRSDRGSYAEAADRAAELIRIVATVHPVESADLTTALTLLGRHSSLRPGDALHAAVALNQGIEMIMTADRHFDLVSGLERIDPLDMAALDAVEG